MIPIDQKNVDKAEKVVRRSKKIEITPEDKARKERQAKLRFDRSYEANKIVMPEDLTKQYRISGGKDEDGSAKSNFGSSISKLGTKKRVMTNDPSSAEIKKPAVFDKDHDIIHCDLVPCSICEAYWSRAVDLNVLKNTENMITTIAKEETQEEMDAPIQKAEDKPAESAAKNIEAKMEVDGGSSVVNKDMSNAFDDKVEMPESEERVKLLLYHDFDNCTNPGCSDCAKLKVGLGGK